MIRTITADDLPAIQALFRDTILTVNAPDYDEEQRLIWAAVSADAARWEARLKEQYFLMAEQKGLVIGFSSLRPDGYLDLLYVHKDFQRQGIAQALYQALETEAQRLNLTQLETDASITARPFFEKMGFALVKEQERVISGVAFTNFRMRKLLL